MNQYLAKIIFRIITGNEKSVQQFDEQLRIIYADNEAAALHEARTIGWQEQDTFENNIGEMVEWKFIGVDGIYKISDQVHGTEILSRIDEHDHAASYIHLIKHKEEKILNQFSLNAESVML